MMNSTAHISGPDKKENKVRGLYTIYSMNSTAQMTDNNFKKLDLNNEENKVKGLYTIYNMNSKKQMTDNNFKKSGPDKKENKVRGLSTIYNMNSKKQMTDNNFKKSGPDKKENKVRGLSTIYNMNSNSKKQMTAKKTYKNLLDTNVPEINVPIMELSERKQMTAKKTYKNLLDTNVPEINVPIMELSERKQMTAKKTYKNLLDTNVPEINVPIMELSERKPSKTNRFNSRKWFQNAVKQTSLQIAHWILNTGKKIIKKLPLPAKIKDLVELVMKSKYYKVPSQNPNQNNKLSEKKNTAFKNNAIVYKLRILNRDDPLNQMMLLNTRKTYLLDKKLNLLKGIKCNETLEVKFEKLGSEGVMIEKSFSFTSKPQVIMNKNGIESALQNMRSDIEIRIDRCNNGRFWMVRYWIIESRSSC